MLQLKSMFPWWPPTTEEITVAVGSDLHPMVEKHYIEWIDIVANGKVYRQFLKPDEEPKAVFPAVEGDVYARAYCNLHGLWKGQ